LGGACLALFLLATPAAASSAIFCDGENISVHIGAGNLVVLSVLGARIATAEKAYSTGPERGDGEPFIAGQAFWDDEQVLIDFTDPNVETILVSVRLRYVAGDEDWPLDGSIIFDGAEHSVRCGLG
jgi:hypothetical protein